MATETPARGNLKRSFITPEGVDLKLELASAGARAGAFMLDAMLIIVILIVISVALGLLAYNGGGEPFAVIWLIGFFILRNGWFVLFEMGGRGATPGKRMMGLRVVARDGARLTGPAVMARNAMREIEVFLPLSFLGARAAEGTADTFLTIFSLMWSGTFLFFPLFNRDRLRIGDIIAGTWVVQTYRSKLSFDLVGSAPAARRTFSDAALNLYGIYELQTLEEVLRDGHNDAIATVARIIRDKASIPDEGDDYGFLSDYYAALCTRLEAGLMVGQRRESKLERLPGR